MLDETPPAKRSGVQTISRTDNNPAGVTGSDAVLTGEAVNASSDHQRAFRDALGKFATGVTIVTVAGAEGPVGMTVNSFASVSLDPALVLWSLDKTSYRYPFFMEAAYFAVHVLDENQAALALDFARNTNAFEGCEWHYGSNNVPLLDECLARFECRRNVVHDGGDHSIIVGNVLQFQHRHGEPLVFASGKFGTVSGMHAKD